jgi:uncharacterized membrane protein YphA (DoxX/SURF4 family)
LRLEERLDRWHAWARSKRRLDYFTWFTRILLAAGFIPPGLKKVVGEPFTVLGPDTAVGYFFDALHQAGWYYAFIGWGQVIAGLLLLLPRTATLGAVLYFPIILNIWAITVAVGFRGTWVITSLMLLANVYLLCWDYDRLKGILPWGGAPERSP